VWGADANDLDRALVVDRNRPRGGEAEGTKSGRERLVPLSRRLRQALAELHLRQGRPAAEEPILGRIDPNNFRKRTWAEICTKARIGARRPKDLRDTFGSWLVSLGAPLPFVQEGLGHSDWATTARHYARWIRAASKQTSPALGPGEVWPDLLARLEPTREITAPTQAALLRSPLR
jgi:integrase